MEEELQKLKMDWMQAFMEFQKAGSEFQRWNESDSRAKYDRLTATRMKEQEAFQKYADAYNSVKR